MKIKLDKIAERGEYQLFYVSGDSDPFWGEIPSEIKNLHSVDKKLKFLLTDCGVDEVKGTYEDHLETIINHTINTADSSGFRTNWADERKTQVEFAGETLKKTIDNLKSRNNPLERSNAHWHDYCTFSGIYFAAYHADVDLYPLLGLPTEILSARVKQQREYKRLADVDNILTRGIDYLCKDSDELDLLIRKVRAGDRTPIKIVAEHPRNHRKLTEEEVEEGLKDYAFNRLELPWLETNLLILNFLKSRMNQ
jgi:hypothetical protein